MLRLASSTVVPNAVRAIASPRILHGSITNALSSCTHDQDSLVKRDTPFLISHQFSTDAKNQIDNKVVNILQSQIKSEQLFLERTKPSVPVHFPFIIEDKSPEGRMVTLTRELDGEKIVVLVYPRFTSTVSQFDEEESVFTSKDVRDDDSDDDDDDDDEQNKKSRANPGQYLNLDVTISKDNGKILAFKVTASPDRIDIDLMSVKEPAPDSDALICYRPNSVRHDEVHLALRKFLEVRGIEKSYVRFLYKYMVWTDKRKMKGLSCDRLTKLQKFIES